MESHLLDGERALWRSLSGPDRRHSAGVARRVEMALGADATRPVVAAALLHDVGKVIAGLRTPGRVVATLLAGRAGRHRVGVGRTGFLRRVAQYQGHPEAGEDLLARAGSDPLTVAWARQHHLPSDRWTVPLPLGHALKTADDD